MAWAAVLSGALLSGVVLLRVMPLGAADIFDNIMHGRIIAVYGANPFVDVVRQYRGDPFYGYTAWRDVPSAYGPAWELLAAWTTRLAGDGIVANVIAFKLVGAAFLAIAAGAVAAILIRKAPRRALAGVALLVWNPVILVQTLGEGHNDIAMAAMVLVGAWLLVERRRTAAILALVAAALLKFIPVLLLPAAGVIALRDQPSTRARVRFTAITGALAIALVALTYAPFWHGEETLGIWRRQGLFTTSLPAVSYSLVGPVLGQARAARIISLTAAALTGAFALYQAARTAHDRSWLAFPRAAFNILMFYLLVTCLWFQDWYTIWPLALAALFPLGREIGLAVLFAYAGLAKPLVFGPQWLWRDPLPPPGWREIRLGPAVLAAPWLYALHAWWRTRRPLNHAPKKSA
jgi:hypothetical protein